MTGLRRLLKYPNQRMTLNRSGGKLHWSLQKGRKMAMMKKGSQQTMKDPVMIANVRAAFRSLFCSIFSLARRSFVRGEVSRLRSMEECFVRSSQLPRRFPWSIIVPCPPRHAGDDGGVKHDGLVTAR